RGRPGAPSIALPVRPPADRLERHVLREAERAHDALADPAAAEDLGGALERPVRRLALGKPPRRADLRGVDVDVTPVDELEEAELPMRPPEPRLLHAAPGELGDPVRHGVVVDDRRP